MATIHLLEFIRTPLTSYSFLCIQEMPNPFKGLLLLRDEEVPRLRSAWTYSISSYTKPGKTSGSMSSNSALFTHFILHLVKIMYSCEGPHRMLEKRWLKDYGCYSLFNLLRSEIIWLLWVSIPCQSVVVEDCNFWRLFPRVCLSSI